MNKMLASMQVVAQQMWYWIFGEIIECGRIAYSVKHLVASEFIVSSSLLVAGAWLLLPTKWFLHPAFAQTLQLIMPVWVLGVIFIIVSRTAIHCTLKADYHWRERMKITITICWCFMLLQNISAHSLGLGTALMFYMTYSSANLAWRLIKLNAAERLGVLQVAKNN